MKRVGFVLFAVIAFVFCSNVVMAHSHTHIGVNQDQISGNSDDNKLWFFSMPGTTGWPNWGEPLELVYQDSGFLAGYYVCEELYCWHSGHPAHGDWQLGGDDEEVDPDWQIGIELVSCDDGFEIRDYETFAPLMTSSGDQIVFPCIWMDEKYNENGELGAWGIHYHAYFAVSSDDVGLGETVGATFEAFDLGTTGYENSDAYTIQFITVPEPATLFVLAIGAVMVRKRRN